MFLATSTTLSFHVNSAGYKLLWLDSTLRSLMPPICHIRRPGIPMFNYNICSDCEVNNGCDVTCSMGNFADMLSLSRAPSKQTRSHK